MQPLLLEAVAFEEHAVQTALRLLQRGANLGKVVVRVGRRESMQELQASSIETQSLHLQAPTRGTDFGTLVHLGIDVERDVAVVELHDPQVSPTPTPQTTAAV